MDNFRAKVFKQAYEMRKSTGKPFAVCLTQSWAIYRLSKRMENETVAFSYDRVDGKRRQAKGTLQGIQHLIKGTGTENYKTFCYFDVEANGFRSFKVENFLAVYG